MIQAERSLCQGRIRRIRFMRSQSEFVELLDRYRLSQAQRLCIGLAIDEDFSRIAGALLLAEGRGKFLRPQWIEQRTIHIPDITARACREFAGQSNPSAHELFQLKLDLTRQLAAAVHSLMALSGGAAKKMLAVCVQDPGIWPVDYDGKPSYEPFCEPNSLAEHCGISVIDGLPQRDLAAGGRGYPIAPLANWLLFADRDRRVAQHSRLYLNLRQNLELTFLPKSDGLDEELPKIQFHLSPGLQFEQLLVQTAHSGTVAASSSHLGAQGKVITELVRGWTDIVSSSGAGLGPLPSWQDPLLQSVRHLVRQPNHASADIIRSANWFMAQQVKHFLSQLQSPPANLQLVPGGHLKNQGLLINEIDRAIGKHELLTFDHVGFQPQHGDGVTTAMLGLMHIDQMPADLPWLTGCEFPRVLGRLTPGRPHNWRQVIMEMADFHPPVMKLREAV